MSLSYDDVHERRFGNSASGTRRGQSVINNRQNPIGSDVLTAVGYNAM
jgi:hypothetical protein